MQELDVLEPQAREVTYRGERLEIQPLAIGVLPKFVRLTRPVIDALLNSSEEALQDGGDVDLLLDLVGEHGEACFEAAALVTGKPVDWICGGDLAEFAQLATAVLEVNRDFFTQRLAPLLAARASKSSGSGPTPSSSSSSTGTA